MVDRDRARLDRQLGRIESQLPGWLARSLLWLRRPSSRSLRVPVGAALMLGGVFSILPLLGLWIIPLGLLLLAQDLPVLRRPTSRALVRLERRWRA